MEHKRQMGLSKNQPHEQQITHKEGVNPVEASLVKVYKNDPFCMFPHNLQEANRLDFQHYLLKHAFQANYLAPIVNPGNILDVACGTGRWMLEMATTFPTTNITGIDLIPPVAGSMINFPSTCKFITRNIIDGLPFTNQSFDFVHQRLLILSLALSYWPTAIQELVRITRSGGWVELVEVDLELHNPGPMGKLIGTWIKQITDEQGIDGAIGRKIESFLRMTNLTHVRARKVNIPIGSWGGRFGTMLAKDFSTAMHSIKPLLVTNNNIKPEVVDQTIDLWIQECDKNHSSYDFFIAYGQRP
jgi:ubiquinone/menaquinone biosynthesis C-methylase UbiE